MFLDKVTVGSSVESATYALVNDTYFISTLKFGPLFYENLKFKFLPYNRKDHCWSRILLSLSLQGKLIQTDSNTNITVQDNLLKVSSDYKTSRFNFEKCFIFDTTNLSLENNIIHHRPPKFTVLDDFELSNLGGKHRWLDPKISNDSLAAKIHFYTSDRVDGANYITDCVVESTLSQENLVDLDYSDSMVRFYVIRYLTFLGIHGNFMKLYKNGTPKYRKPKVTHKKRIVIKKEMNVYEDSQNIKFLDKPLERIFDEVRTSGT